MPVCLQIFQGYFLMDAFIPFLDLDPHDVESLRSLIDRDYVSKVTDALTTQECFEVHTVSDGNKAGFYCDATRRILEIMRQNILFHIKEPIKNWKLRLFSNMSEVFLCF